MCLCAYYLSNVRGYLRIQWYMAFPLLMKTALVSYLSILDNDFRTFPLHTYSKGRYMNPKVTTMIVKYPEDQIPNIIIPAQHKIHRYLIGKDGRKSLVAIHLSNAHPSQSKTEFHRHGSKPWLMGMFIKVEPIHCSERDATIDSF